MARDTTQPAMMQRDNEISRVVVEGRRTDDDDRCTLVVVHERYRGGWAFYPHGWGTFGVRLEKSAATKVAQTILADGAQ